jgi:tetratricopeptide (TPR) repeat protein
VNSYYYDLKGQICHTLAKHEEAAAALEKMIQLAPGNVDNYFDAANQYIYAKNYKAALDVYDRMEDRFGVGEDLIRQKEQLYLMLGKPEKAVEELKKLIRAAPGDTRYQGMLAELYWSMGKKEEAVAIYRDILGKEPENGFAHFGMAEYYRSENNKDKMFSELNAAFEDPRIDLEPKLNVIFSLLPAIDSDPSIKKPVFKLAETARNAHPNEARAHAVLADLYRADGREDAALEEYRIAIGLDPANLEIWNHLCEILLKKGEFRDLQIESDKALEYFPEQAILYYYNATAHYQLKAYRDVVTASQLGLGLYAPEKEINLQLYILLGDGYHNLNDHEASDKAFTHALELDPDHTYVLNNYAYYLSIRKTELEKAKVMSAKTLELEPNSPSFLDTYGWILYQMDDAKGALTYIAKALTLSPESPEILEHMGDVLHKLNRDAEAKKYWEKALGLNPNSKELRDKIDGTFVF